MARLFLFVVFATISLPLVAVESESNKPVEINVNELQNISLDDKFLGMVLYDIYDIQATLIISSGVWEIKNSLIIPPKITLKINEGVILKISSGKTLIIQGSLVAGAYKLFAGNGKCRFQAISKYNEVFPQWWGAKGDGVSVDTRNIQSALDSIIDGGILRLAKGTYLHNGEPIIIYSNIKIQGEESIIKLEKKRYNENAIFFQTKWFKDGSYDSKIPVTANITFDRITLDGSNNEVVTKLSCTGFNLYKVNNAKITNCNIVNLPGKTGGGYGIISWYSDKVAIDNVKVNGTDRQNICIWETENAKISNCILNNSYYRENILVSTNSPYSFQKSFCDIENTKCTNENSTGKHIVRFSGSGNGTIKNCQLKSNRNFEGIYITDKYYKNITIENNVITECKYGILIESETNKFIKIVNNKFENNQNGIRINSGHGIIFLINNSLKNSKGQSLYINGPDIAIVEDNKIEDGTKIFFSINQKLEFNRNAIIGQSDSDYSVVISSKKKDSISNIANNVLSDNASDKIRVYTKGRAIENTGKIVSQSLEIIN